MKKYLIYTLIMCILLSLMMPPTLAGASDSTIWLGDECVTLSTPLLTDNHGTYIHVEDLKKLGFTIENQNGDFLLDFQGNTLFVTERSNIVCMDGIELFYPYPTSGQKYISLNIIRDIYCMDSLKTQEEIDSAAELELAALEEPDYSKYENEYDDCGNIIAKEEEHLTLLSDENVQLMSSTVVYRTITLQSPVTLPSTVYIKVTLNPEYNYGIYGGNIYDGYIYRGSYTFYTRFYPGETTRTCRVALTVSEGATLRGFTASYSLEQYYQPLWGYGYYNTAATTAAYYNRSLATGSSITLNLLERKTVKVRVSSPEGFEKSYFSGSLSVTATEGVTAGLSFPSTAISWGGTNIYGHPKATYTEVPISLPSSATTVSFSYKIYNCPESIISNGYFCEDPSKFDEESKKRFNVSDLEEYIPELKLVLLPSDERINYNAEALDSLNLTSSSSRWRYVYLQLYNAASVSQTPVVFVSYYGKDNKLLYMESAQTTIPSEGYRSVRIQNTYNYAQEVKYAKLLIWNDRLLPIGASCELD